MQNQPIHTQITFSGLIEDLEKRFPHFREPSASRIANLIRKALVEQLVSGGRIEIRGFGSIFLKERRARMGRNPKTNERIELQRRYTVAFKAGKALRERINNKKGS